MTAQSFLAKNGLRTGVLGSAADLAIAAPLAAGNPNPAAGTDASRIGFFFDRTGGSEAVGAVVMGTEIARIQSTGLMLQEGGVRFIERAAVPAAPVAGQGYLWVRNDSPNVLVFTNDAGADTVLGAGGGELILNATGTDNLGTSNLGSFAAIAAGAGDNVAIGRDSLAALTTGNDNIAIGDIAGTALTVPSSNILIGFGSGSTLINGGSNTLIGTGTAANSTSTSSAVALGASASAESQATAIGSSAQADFTGSIAVGHLATTTAINQMVIGSGTQPIDNVYIGDGVTSGSPNNVVLHATGGSGVDIAGASLTLAGGISTGAALGGSVVIQVSDSAASSAVANTLQTIGTFAVDGLQVLPDTDNDCTFGRATIGSVFVDQMTLAHLDNFTAGNFALNQASNGLTTINAASGQEVRISVGGNTKVAVDTTTVALSTGINVTLDTGILFTERAAVPAAPGAGNGYLWVRNDTPNVLVYTDDAGTDTVLGAGGGGGELILNATGTDNLGTSNLGTFAAIAAGASNNIGIGRDSLTAITTATQNVALGARTLESMLAGSSNVVVGHQAAIDMTSGDNNVIIGLQAGLNGTGGSNHIFIGNLAGRFGRTGTTATNHNTFIGYRAGQGNPTPASNTGSANIGIGADTLFDLSSGVGNLAIGFFSGSNLTTGTFNTAIGYRALITAATSSNLIAIGNTAYENGTGGDYHVGIGTESLRYGRTSTTATDSSIGIGYRALRGSTTAANNTGARNIAIGSQVMLVMTSGADNIGIGHLTLDAVTTGQTNVGIGNGALGSLTIGSNNTVLGHSAGAALISINENTLMGAQALLAATNSTRTVIIGYQCAMTLTGGDDIVAVGHQAMMNAAGATNDGCVAIGAEAMLNGRTNTSSTNSSIGIGVQALLGNVTPANNTGDHNIGIGYRALASCAGGGSNIAVGNGAADNMTSANRNIAIGVDTANGVSTGSDSVYIGHNCGQIPANGSSNVLIGSGTDTNGSADSNTIALGLNAVGRSATIVLGTSAIATANNQCIIGGTGTSITSVYIGRGVTNGAPQAVVMQTTGGSGTDIGGADFTIAGGRGTGTGAGGDVTLQYAPAAAATGSTPNSLIDGFVMTGVAQSVNGLQLTLSASGAAVQLATIGTDANIDLALEPKGTGIVTCDAQFTLSRVAKNEQVGTSYQLVAADGGHVIYLTNGGAITLTLPQQSTETLDEGFQCTVVQGGAGTVSLATEGTDTLLTEGSLTSLSGQGAAVTIILRTAGSPNAWYAVGSLA